MHRGSRRRGTEGGRGSCVWHLHQRPCGSCTRRARALTRGGLPLGARALRVPRIGRERVALPASPVTWRCFCGLCCEQSALCSAGGRTDPDPPVLSPEGPNEMEDLLFFFFPRRGGGRAGVAKMEGRTRGTKRADGFGFRFAAFCVEKAAAAVLLLLLRVCVIFVAVFFLVSSAFRFRVRLECVLFSFSVAWRTPFCRIQMLVNWLLVAGPLRALGAPRFLLGVGGSRRG